MTHIMKKYLECCNYALTKKQVQQYINKHEKMLALLCKSWEACNGHYSLQNEPELREVAACKYLADISVVWATIISHNHPTECHDPDIDKYRNYIKNMMYLKECVDTNDFCQLCDRMEYLLAHIVCMTQKKWYYGIEQILKECERKNAEFVSQNAIIFSKGYYAEGK